MSVSASLIEMGATYLVTEELLYARTTGAVYVPETLTPEERDDTGNLDVQHRGGRRDCVCPWSEEAFKELITEEIIEKQ